MRRRSLQALLTVPLVALPLLALGCDTKLDQPKFEGDLRQYFKEKSLVLTKVSCPANQILKKDVTFTCSITDDNGSTGVVTAVATDNKGTVKWQLQGKYEDTKVVGDHLEESISKTTQGQKVDVTCPSKNMLVKKDVTFTCDVKVGEGATQKDAKIQFTAQDDSGNWATKLL